MEQLDIMTDEMTDNGETVVSAINNNSKNQSTKRPLSEMESSADDDDGAFVKLVDGGDQPESIVRNRKKPRLENSATKESHDEEKQEVEHSTNQRQNEREQQENQGEEPELSNQQEEPEVGQQEDQEETQEEEQEAQQEEQNEEEQQEEINEEEQQEEQEEGPDENHTQGKQPPLQQEGEGGEQQQEPTTNTEVVFDDNEDDLLNDESEHNKAIESVLENLVSIDRDGKTAESNGDVVHIGYDSSTVHDPHLDTLEVEVITENSKDSFMPGEDVEQDNTDTKAPIVRTSRRSVKSVPETSSGTHDKSKTVITKNRVGPKSRMAANAKRGTFKKRSKDDDEDYVMEESDLSAEIEYIKEATERFRPRALDNSHSISYEENLDDIPDFDHDEEAHHEGPGEFVVEKVLGKRTGRDTNGVERIEYKIKWDGYPSSSNTWEPLCNLADCDDAIKEFEETQALMLSKKKASIAAVSRQNLKRTHDDSDDSSTPKKKKSTTTKSSAFKTIIDDSEVEVTEIIGLSKCGKEKYFLMKFHESSKRDPQFLRSSVAAKLIPLKVIDFYTKHVVWK